MNYYTVGRRQCLALALFFFSIFAPVGAAKSPTSTTPPPSTTTLFINGGVSNDVHRLVSSMGQVCYFNLGIKDKYLLQAKDATATTWAIACTTTTYNASATTTYPCDLPWPYQIYTIGETTYNAVFSSGTRSVYVLLFHYYFSWTPYISARETYLFANSTFNQSQNRSIKELGTTQN